MIPLALRLTLALFGALFLAAGLAFAFDPLRIAADFAVSPIGAAGFGTLRADLGGLFLAMGATTLLGLRRGHAQWLTVPLALIGCILALRLLHVGLDGFTPGGARSLALEAVAVALLFAGRRVLAEPARIA